MYSAVFPNVVVETCAYVVFWGCRGGLAMWRMFRYVGLDIGVGLEEESLCVAGSGEQPRDMSIKCL